MKESFVQRKVKCQPLLLPWIFLLVILSSTSPAAFAQSISEAPSSRPTESPSLNTTNTTNSNSTNTTDFEDLNIDYQAESILALRWKLVKPDIAYDGLRFDLEYTTSDYIQESMVKYSIFDGHDCINNGGTGNVVNDAGYITIGLNGDNTPLGGGLLTRQMTLSTTIEPTTITDSVSYEDLGDTATIKFCVRFGIHDEDLSINPSADEINHQITTIQLIVDLTDDFKIQDQIVEAVETGEETSNDAFFIEGFICESDGSKPQDILPLAQGSTVRVCVQPTSQAYDVGFRMRRMDSFTFSQEYLTQDAVRNGKEAINGLTQLQCEPGADQCIFETLLLSYFYTEYAFLVSGTGIATLQFGGPDEGERRGLGARRRYLQQNLPRGIPKTFDTEKFGVQRTKNRFKYSSSALGTTAMMMLRNSVLSIAVVSTALLCVMY